MKGLREYYRTRNKREKALIWVVTAIAVFTLIYYSDALTPYGNQDTETELKEKALLLRKLQALIGREEIIKKEASGGPGLGGIKLLKTTHEGQVLTEIPRLLKKISAKCDLVLSKSDIAQKETLCTDPLLLKLGLAVEIDAIPKAEKLQEFLYQLENNEDFTCYIKELDIKAREKAQGVSLVAGLETFALVER